MRILGLDVGDRRIGVALCDPMQILASPLMIIEARSDRSEFDAIVALIKEHGVEKIVVGFPRSMDGSVGEQATKTEGFVQSLKGLTSVPIEFSDERLSTSIADKILRDKGKKPHQIKQERDAVAAALILQWYLDEHPPKEF